MADGRSGDDGAGDLLVEAAREGDLKRVRALVEAGGANVNARGRETALIAPASRGHFEVVQYLVDRGADVNAVGIDGWTSLMCAAESGELDVVQYLVDRGADVNAVDKDGKTSLMRAASGGKLDVVQYLVDRGADVNFKTVDGQTAALLATERGHIAIRRFLLQHVRRISTAGGSSGGVKADPSLVSSTSVSTSKSWTISPFDIKLVEFVDVGTIGGEYRAKWLDADVVVKLFVPDASASTFAEEVTVWHQLRHPNVIKLYGACDVGHSFFVLEYASNGSLVEYLAGCKRNGERCTPWKFLYESALGLAYLHERKIVHGNLRGSNILVGSDGVAKLADFGLTVSTRAHEVQSSSTSESFGSVRWQAPEQLEGNEGGASFAADIYSFGLCVVEAMSGRAPWGDYSDQRIASCKLRWDPVSDSSTWMAPGPLDADTRFLTSRMCALSPDQRVVAVSVVRMLERLAAKEANKHLMPHPQSDTAVMNVDEYKNGALTLLWSTFRGHASQHDEDSLYQLVFQDIEAMHEQLVQARRPRKLLDAYHKLLEDLDIAIRPESYRNLVAALSSTRATGANLNALRRRVNSFWAMLDDSRSDDQKRDRRWEAQRKKQLELFVSEVSQTMVVLSNLDDEEDRRAFIALLRSEIDSHASDYTEGQLAVMKQACAEIVRDEASELVTTTPVWFLPWYELVIDKMKRLGEGGFGNVYRAKWLDSDVVVKQVKKLGANNESGTPTWSMSMSQSATSIRAGTPANDIEARKALRSMFEREVDVWFGLSHPHVVRLFGACHVGTPFFACEYAGLGSLDKYLRRHPDQLWTKLHEAALGVQYLQSRGIVHGDLKCNNIVVGNDGKAKVTDFGLSSLSDEDEDAQLTGAWQWVAPECIKNGASKRSFASDVYALGMCIVEALRVAEFVKLKKIDGKGPPPLPWGDFGDTTVKVYVTKRRELPLRPQLCTDEQWRLVERMCVYDPTERIKISTVVDELAVLTQGDVPEEATATEPECESRATVLSLSAVIAEMRKWNHQFQDDAGSSNLKVLCRVYQLLWDRLEHLTCGKAKGEAVADIECLRPLVERAQRCTRALAEWKDTLFEFTEAALRGYALHRGLDKVIDAHFWRTDGEGGDVHDWRPRCLSYLTGSSGEE